MKLLLPLLLIPILSGCAATVQPAITYNECERNAGASWQEHVKLLNKGFHLEDVGDIALRDDEYIVRFYEDFSIAGETVIQAIMKDGTMMVEMRTPEAPIKADVMEQSRKEIAGKREIRYITAAEYVPATTLKIYRHSELDEEKVWRIRRFIEQRDLLTLKNIFHCEDNGEEVMHLDGVSYTMEIRKGNRRHLVAFTGGEYKYAPYMELMALFRDPWPWPPQW